jgi:hypothetical protein
MPSKKIRRVNNKQKYSLLKSPSHRKRTGCCKRLSLEHLEQRLVLSSDPIITEFLASNAANLADADGDYPDWIEIYNPNATALDISGWYLTDNPSKPTKYQITAGTTIAAYDYLVIFCNDEDTHMPSDPDPVQHTNFKLDAQGEYLALIKPDGATIVSQFGTSTTNYPPQTTDVSYGLEMTSSGTTVTINVTDDFSAGVEGFTYADDIISSGDANLVSGGYSSTGGNSGGCLQVSTSMSSSKTVNGGFSKSITIGAAGTYSFSVDVDLILSSGSSYPMATTDSGTAYLLVKNSSGSIVFQRTFVKTGNGSSYTLESGWTTLSGSATLSAGTYTVIVALMDSTRVSGTGPKYIDAYFDNFSYPTVIDIPLVGTAEQYYTVPTPGAANNTEGFLGTIEDEVEFSVDHGFFTEAFSLTLACDMPGTAIYYTTDGSAPTPAGGTLYSGAITISSTTVVRAAAFKTGYLTANVSTQSYFFLADVITQSTDGTAPDGWPSAGWHYYDSTYYPNYMNRYFDYGIDPDVISTYGTEALISSLSSVATVSIVTDLDNLFGAENGIIVNSNQDLETTASMEYIPADGTEGFTMNASVKLRAGYSAFIDTVTKYGFHLKFDEDVVYNLFGEDAATTFSKLDLRVNQNWSWSKEGDTNGTFVRDTFSRETQLDIGELATHGQVVMVYINGEFWGAYEIEERIDANYAASYLGGNANDYDVLKTDRDTSGEYSVIVTDGNANAWTDLYNQMLGQFTVNYVVPTSTVTTVSQAENVLSDSALQYYMLTGSAATINYINTGSGGHYSGSSAFPGLDTTTDADNFIIEIQGTITISSSDNWTFGVTTSESFKFELTNGTDTYTFTYDGTGSVADVLQTFNIASAGDYNLRIVYVETTGGADLELYAAQGTYTTFSSSAFDLVGDTAHGGIALPGMASDVAYQRVQGNNPDGTKNENYDKLLDVQNLIDYMLIIFYTANDDAPVSGFLWENVAGNWYNFIQPNNFFVAYNHEDPDGFKFILHDSEHTLNCGVGWIGQGESLLKYDYPSYDPGHFPDGIDDANPYQYFYLLTSNSDFLAKLADRIQEETTGDGALTDAACLARYDALTTIYATVIVAEAARWGDHMNTLNSSNTVCTPAHWYSAVASERAKMSTRTQTLISLIRGYTNYYSAAYPAPTSSLTEGEVPANSTLTLTKPSPQPGVIYYTLDGSDPCDSDGSVSSTALVYVSGTSITITQSTELKARILYTMFGTWSPLLDAEYYVGAEADSTNLAITEINYHPYDPTAAEIAQGFTDAEMFEFIEIKNIGTTTVDISKISFTFGVTWNAGFVSDQSYNLAPGDIVAIVADPAAFAYRYGSGVPIVGAFTGALSNAGEKLTLVNRSGEVISSVTYSDGGDWPGRADGNGSTLQIIDPAGDENDPDNWRSSVEYGGTPGADGLLSYNDVIINEVLSHTDSFDGDKIELYNITDYALDIGGWYLSDSSDNYLKYCIPEGTIIAAHGYHVFTEEDFGEYFALDAFEGDDVWLLTTDAAGNLQYFADHVEFGAALNGVSFGRWPNGHNDSVLYSMSSQTFGADNSGPAASSVVISEVFYSPGNNNYEFVEIYNSTASAIDLTNWKLGGAVEFDFSSGSVTALGAYQTLVVVENIAAFQSLFGTSIAIAGQYSGNLNDDGETLTLYSAGAPPAEEPDFYPAILEDQVKYDNASPWPIIAAGESLSLQRVTTHAWGNDATSWIAAAPTPGSYTSLAEELLVDADDWAAAGSSGLTLTIGTDGKLHVYITGTTTDVVTPLLPAYVTNVAITGRDNIDDVLTVDFGPGDPVSSGGVSFDAGSGGGNALLIIGASANDEVVLSADQITVNASAAINYANCTRFGFGLAGGDNTLTIDNATLIIYQADAISAGTDVILDGGVLDLNGLSDTIGDFTLLSGSVINGTLHADLYAIESGTVTAALAGPGEIYKTTGGEASVTDINNSNTTVSQGSLTATSIITGTLTIGAGAKVTISPITSGGNIATDNNPAAEPISSASGSKETAESTSSPPALAAGAPDMITGNISQESRLDSSVAAISDYATPIVEVAAASIVESSSSGVLPECNQARQVEAISDYLPLDLPIIRRFDLDTLRIAAMKDYFSKPALETRPDARQDRPLSSFQDESLPRMMKVKKQPAVEISGAQNIRDLALWSVSENSRGKSPDEQLISQLYNSHRSRKNDKLLEEAVDAVLAWGL